MNIIVRRLSADERQACVEYLDREARERTLTKSGKRYPASRPLPSAVARPRKRARELAENAKPE